MADIQYWDDTLTDEIETVRALLDRIPSISSDMERSSALDKAEKKLRSAQGTKRSFKMETRLVSDPNQRKRYENQLARHEETLKALTADLQALRSNTQKGQLFMGGRQTAATEMSAEQTGDAMLQEANTLQDKTQESLDNTKSLVAQSKEVGMATMEELHKQRQQIQNIDDEAMRIEDNLKRADKLIKTFGKRMATDKFIQCCTCLNVLLLVGVVVYSVVKGGSLTSDKDSGEPQSPVRKLLQWSLRGSLAAADDVDLNGQYN